LRNQPASVPGVPTKPPGIVNTTISSRLSWALRPTTAAVSGLRTAGGPERPGRELHPYARVRRPHVTRGGSGSSRSTGLRSTTETSSRGLSLQPLPASPPGPSSPAGEGIVDPSAFCSPQGATGHTSAGTRMVCEPASDGAIADSTAEPGTHMVSTDSGYRRPMTAEAARGRLVPC
jgi:hypothetical protein